MIKKIIMAAGLMFSASLGWAAGGGDVHLEHMSADMSDTVSLQNGLRTYMDYCAGCHSLGYARYNRVARDLDIPEDLFMENIVFSENAKFGDLMKFAMSSEDGKAWFGAAPPDLTMVTRVRGIDWVYSYLLGFYKDDTRPYGVNNAVFKDVGMPHVLMDLQGLCSSAPHPIEEVKIDPLTGESIHSEACADYTYEGELSSHEYEQVVYNLVNFLNYMGEPYQMDRKRIGIYVFAFLAVLFFVSLLLQRELFKDIKH